MFVKKSNIFSWLGLAFFIVLIFGCARPAGKNRLQAASSPYLREHADNPVDWYEWGGEALDKAQKENKPLLISIGYASCHWCHVMEKESFMDKAVAEVMNDNFICIKVDREERPDIDNIYMEACQLITGGGGGWPLNAFALPDGRPFYATTYNPKESWLNLLNQVSDAFKNQKNKVLLQANALTYEVQDYDREFFKSKEQGSLISKEIYRNFYDSLYLELDAVHGGLTGAPKFPMPAVWEFLLQYYYYTHVPGALEIVDTTLVKMASGGIYDHLGGGFARYATDTNWHIPHFEKMLYDNGQLLSLYSHGYQLTRSALFKNVVYETAAFAERELLSPEGGFYSSVNADSETGEGTYYAWSTDEFRSALNGKDADLLSDYFQVTASGNWEDERNILIARQSPEQFAKGRGMPVEAFLDILASAKKKLLAEREKRTPPAVDKKILTAWNAVMLKGLLDAYTVFGEKSFLTLAEKNAGFLEENMLRTDGKLWRNYMEGNTSVSGFLDDYALLARSYIRLYQVTFDKHWLDLSGRIAAYAVKYFMEDSTGFFYYTSSSSDRLAVRKPAIRDDALPASNAVMAETLFDLGVYYENDQYIDLCRRMVGTIAGRPVQNAPFFASWFTMAGLLANGTHEVAIMGKESMKKNLELQKSFLPDCLFMGSDDKEDLPLLENKLVENRTMVYVCTNRSCKLPVEETEKALEQLRKPNE